MRGQFLINAATDRPTWDGVGELVAGDGGAAGG